MRGGTSEGEPAPEGRETEPEGAVGELPARLRLNAFSNYANTIVSLVLALVMTPVLVHGLGTAGYGLWTLVGSLLLYLQIFNLGFATANQRFVSHHVAQGRLGAASRVVATTVQTLSIPGVVAGALGAALAFSLPDVFAIPPGQRTTATVLMLIVSVELALSIPLDTFGGVLMAFNRWDLLNLTLIAVSLGQAVGWVVVLALGGGLVPLGLVTVALSLAAQVTRYLLVRRLLGGLSLAPRMFDRTQVRPLASMSLWVAIEEITFLVIAKSDAIVVGAADDVAAVGVYAVGAKLAQLATQAVDPVAHLFYPHAARLSARDEPELLAQLIRTGTRLVMALALPAAIVIVVLAHPGVEAWVGKGFGSAAVVAIYLAVFVFTGLTRGERVLLFGRLHLGHAG